MGPPPISIFYDQEVLIRTWVSGVGINHSYWLEHISLEESRACIRLKVKGEHKRKIISQIYCFSAQETHD
jgi:hypothetical protein